MSARIITTQDFPLVCRTCLRKTSLVPIAGSSAGNMQVNKLLWNCLLLPIDDVSDTLPEHICIGCINTIYQFYLFKKQCHNNDALLRLLLQSQATEFEAPDKDVKEEIILNVSENDCDIEIKEETIDSKTDNDNFSALIEIESETVSPVTNNKNNSDHDYAFKNVEKDQEIESASDNDEKQDFEQLEEGTDKLTETIEDTYCNQTLDTKAEHEKQNKDFDIEDMFKKRRRSTKMCEFCGKVYAKDFKRHIMVHLNQRPHKCEVCSKSFVKKEVLRRHMTTHSDERPFICSICGISFSRLDYLKGHELTHKKEKEHSFFCNKCDKSFFTFSGLYSHKSKTHRVVADPSEQVKKPSVPRRRRPKVARNPALETYPYSCPHCGLNYKKIFALTKHLQLHDNNKLENSGADVLESDGNKNYMCQICNKSFKNRASLYSHVGIHKEKKLKCVECGRKFRSTRDLKVHFGTHTQERPFKCTQCPRAFRRKQKLRLHYLIHTGEFLYTCEYCGRGFRQKISLSFHYKTHTGEPHRCTICGEEFETYEKLKVHRRQHREEENNDS